MSKVDKIIKETKSWLDEHGYNFMVARVHLEALELKNRELKIKLCRELLV